jgi:hypothetical protein
MPFFDNAGSTPNDSRGRSDFLETIRKMAAEILATEEARAAIFEIAPETFRSKAPRLDGTLERSPGKPAAWPRFPDRPPKVKNARGIPAGTKRAFQSLRSKGQGSIEHTRAGLFVWFRVEY